MTQRRMLFVSATAIALTFGLQFPDPKLIGGPSPLPNDGVMVLAANDEQSGQPQAQAEENADQSAKNAAESDTMNTPGLTEDEEAKKPDQPPGAQPGNEN